MQNDRFLRALRKQPVDKTPVWIMRQAGRYLPEYMATRQKAGDFLTLCKTPELACEVTLQPLARFDLDAAILFSDILTIPDAMGLGLYFSENEGPKFTNPIQNEHDINSLAIPDPETDLRYVMDAARLISHELRHKLPLIGFSGSPWTLATYMIEGGTSKNFTQTKAIIYSKPTIIEKLLEILAKSIALYLKAQIAAGVQAVMLFDTWGGVLTTEAYQRFSLKYMSAIIAELKNDIKTQSIPIILYTKGGSNWLSDQAASGADALGVDWTIRLDKAYQMTNKQVALQGNMDPIVLFGEPKYIEQEVASVLEQVGQQNGHIFNLGHGILPNTPPDNVAVMVDAVHRLSLQYHR